MKAEINQFGKLIITIGYNFSVSCGNSDIALDKRAAQEMMASIIGKPVRDSDDVVIGKIIDMTAIPENSQYYTHIEIDDRFKDRILALISMSRKDVSMSYKIEGNNAKN